MTNLFKKCLSALTFSVFSLAMLFQAAPVFAAPSVIMPISAPVYASNWKMENGSWYYYKNGEKAKNEWQKDSRGWCYLGSDGAWVKNALVKDSKGLCFVGEDGYWSQKEGWKMDASTKKLGVHRS